MRSYKAGALRSAISAAWVALVYDLVSKYRELSTMGDAAAAAFLSAWDSATANGDVKKLLQLEAEILEDAAERTQLISRVGETQLKRLREDRHLCAHPAFSSEADLFVPTPELVRMHLVNCIEYVLSQEPLQGKTILVSFGADVQSPGFPLSNDKIKDYVEQKYLARTRPEKIVNFGIVLAKSLLKGVPSEWSSAREQVAASLVAVRDRAVASWPDISARIVRLIDGAEPERRLSAIAFLGNFPEFYGQLQDSTKMAFIETIRNLNPAELQQYEVLAAINVPAFSAPLKAILASLGPPQIAAAIKVSPLDDVWPKAIEIYSDSGSFRGSESNFAELVLPFAGRLEASQLESVLNAIAGNGQNWDASETPELLLRLLKNTQPENLPNWDSRDAFFRELAGQYKGAGRFTEVFDLLSADGWAPPKTKKDAE